LGFLKYGYTETAERIKHGILELVSNHEFIEYYGTYKRGIRWKIVLVGCAGTRYDKTLGLEFHLLMNRYESE
jgi:hypothetical protein